MTAEQGDGMSLYQLDEHAPVVHETAYVAPGSTVIGKVELHENTSVWPGAVLRGDNEPIIIGKGSNVQDGAVMHTDPGCPLQLGENVTIGHQAMLHGCRIGNNSLIGIQAVILNHAVIGSHSLVGAGAVVTEGKVFPERSLILGAPAKVVRTLSDEEVASLQDSADTYQARARQFQKGLMRL